MSRNGNTRRLSREAIQRIASDLGADNLERSGSDETHNRRYAVRASITQLHIPARNTEAADGSTFQGLPGNRLAEDAVNSPELASGDTNAERAVDAGHIKDNVLSDRMVNGKWSRDKVPNIDSLNGTLDVGRTGGQLSGKRITGKVPKANIGGVDWNNVDGKPKIVQRDYVDKGDISVRKWVKNNFAPKKRN